jgi:hypothetical protein
LTAARILRGQVALFAAVAATSTIASAWLIPTRGVLGAAWALLAGYLVQLIGSLCLSWYAVGRPAHRRAALQ